SLIHRLPVPSSDCAAGPAAGALDTTTNTRGSAKRNAAFTLQHGTMLTPRQPESCVPMAVSRCAPALAVDISNPALEPLPRLRLHLRVEFVRCVIEARAALLRRAGFLVTGVELVEAGAYSVEVE